MTIFGGVLPLGDLGLQTAAVGQDPQLQELHLLRLGVIALRVLGTRAECHALHAACFEDAAASDAVRVLEMAGNDVGDAFDVAMWVHRPYGAWRQRVVIEHAQRTDAHVGRVVVLVEAEVPTGAEPTAVSREDFLVATYY